MAIKKKTAKKSVLTKTSASIANNKVETPKPLVKRSVKVAKKVAEKKPASKKTVVQKLIATPAKKTASILGANKSLKKVVTAKPSLDAIAKAAYLNYRRRVENGMPGNSQSDWLEAELEFKNQA